MLSFQLEICLFRMGFDLYVPKVVSGAGDADQIARDGRPLSDPSPTAYCERGLFP